MKNNHEKCAVLKNCSTCLLRSCLSKINTIKGRKTVVPVEVESEHYQKIFPRALTVIVKQVLEKALMNSDLFLPLCKPAWFCTLCNENIPDGMYYLMLSRVQDIDQIYLEMPKSKRKSKQKSEKIELKIRANASSLKENEKLVERSIVPNYKENSFSVFMLNIASLKNKITDLKLDMYAQVADHICLVETWIDPKSIIVFNLPER